MPKGPAARTGDPVSHPLPPVLIGMGSSNVLISKRPAWRGLPAGAAPGVLAAKQAADTAIQGAEAVTIASIGTSAFPGSKAAEDALKASAAVSMGNTITAAAASAASAAGAPDTHTCSTLLPIPPHGPGVVVDGSGTVRINGLPACRVGDTIVEAVGPPNKIVGGESTVIIGG